MTTEKIIDRCAFFNPYIVVVLKIENFLELSQIGGKHFFTAIKEGDELKFATNDENERHLWVQVKLIFDFYLIKFLKLKMKLPCFICGKCNFAGTLSRHGSSLQTCSSKSVERQHESPGIPGQGQQARIGRYYFG